MNEQVLYYTPAPSEADLLLLTVLMSMGIRLRKVDASQLHEQVGALAGLPGFSLRNAAAAGTNTASPGKKSEPVQSKTGSDPAKGAKTPVSSKNSAPAVPEKFMVLHGFTQKRLDEFLSLLRQNKMPPALKAVLTETNAQWTMAALYKELRAEHDAIAAQQKKHS